MSAESNIIICPATGEPCKFQKLEKGRRENHSRRFAVAFGENPDRSDTRVQDAMLAEHRELDIELSTVTSGSGTRPCEDCQFA